VSRYGYFLSAEEYSPRELVSQARMAEQAGFEALWISDHFHPWLDEQGQSGFVWSLIGAISQVTSLPITTAVTCPLLRQHPAIVAQAAATSALLTGGRFTLGVGTGEALNEHILGHRWPRPEVRLAMLEEAVTIMRKLWQGDTVDFRGDFYEVENARLFDPPPRPVPVVVSGFGEKAAELAGRIGDGFWGTSPERDLVEAFERAGGAGPRYAQLNVCVAASEEDGRKTVREIWPNAGVSGQLSQDLPTWTHFEQASEPLTEEQITKSVPCGPDILERVLDSVGEYLDAGYDHLYFHQIGRDQDVFFRFWQDQLRAALADR
jgi:G6PDH family F420-dependent oxidoreductase